MKTRYWIIVASRDHVRMGTAGGYAQACHGKASPLRRMQPGDGVIYYSSKEKFGEDAKCQRFTAIGTVKDERVYSHAMSETFMPFRRDVAFAPCEEASILPLIDQLSFITDKKHWGAPFRFGMLEIPQADYELITSKMLTKETA